MSSKKQKSVLAADNTAKAVAAPVVSAAGYATTRFDSKGFRSDDWNYADDEVVMDVNGNYITFGELKKRKAEGYYDDWDAEEEKSSAAKKQEEAEEKEAAKRTAELNAYRTIVREAYQDYRRNLERFPEMEVLLSSGDADNLFTQNDIIFQEQVKEEAQRVGKKNKKLVGQTNALTQPHPKL